MHKILLISDNGVPTGYGRIADNVGVRLHQRGNLIVGASFAYDGLLPPTHEGKPLPYHVASLQRQRMMGNWVEDVVKLIGATRPDVVMVVQDAPYAEAVYNTPVDWSQHKFVVITPVDGVPILPTWVNFLREADGMLSISQFGVDAYRQAGVRAELCRPGINPAEFYALSDQERAELRQQVGIPHDAFVLGTMAQNQGRKAIPLMLEGFFEFAKTEPNAFYLLDMDAISPMGWDIRQLCQQNRWDARRLIFREDILKRAGLNLMQRYNLLDAHAVLSHREGYGLPLVEAMACGVVSIAMDYCSGREIVGDGRGVLINPLPFANYSTWGGSMDKFPDVAHFVEQLHRLNDEPHQRAELARVGMEWARAQTWDHATDNVAMVIERAMAGELPPTVAPSKPKATIVSVDNHPVSKNGQAIPIELIEGGM